jgi:teichuronic acid biosynthesis glycosyltransferase TuaG
MISILMPIYNGIEYIEESVSSIIAQTYENWELIIGINGHEPNSTVYQTANTYVSHKIRVFDYTTKGKPSTLNEMVKECKGEYIALLDVDDIWHPLKLEKQTPLLNHYDVIGSRCIYFGDLNGIVPAIPTGDISLVDFHITNPIINSSSIIRKSLCYWNPDCFIEDYDLWLRLRKAGHTFYNLNEILVKHRIHRESAFNSKGNHSCVADLINHHK